jgi:uncharacterized protein YggE
MRRPSTLLLFSVLSLWLVACASERLRAQGVVAGPAVGPQIITTATGEAELTPDRATVYIGVETRATTASLAARENAQRQSAVIDGIVGAGVPRSQIATENYSVAPNVRFDPATQKSTVDGYVVTNTVRVELQRIDQVSAVLDAALAKGANQINSLDFYASNADSARRVALSRAVIRARADAEAVARAAGGSIGALLELSTIDAGPRPVFRTMNAAQAAPTPIEPGQQRVQASITTRWEYISPRK